jgi:hypothetical protein
MSKLLTSCQLYNYRPRKDKSLSITFITGEKTPEQVMEIHSMLDDFGYLLFKAEEKLTKDEIAEIDKLDTDLYDNPKTQSQRIRNCIMVIHEKSNSEMSKHDLYHHWTERILSTLKKEIDRLTI